MNVLLQRLKQDSRQISDAEADPLRRDRGLIARLAKSGPPPYGATLSDYLSESDRRALHDAALMDCTLVSVARDIPLLHANRRTQHYFDCDRLLTRQSTARDITASVTITVAHLLAPRFLACTIAPEGLVGTYPLCFHIALASSGDIVAVLRHKEQYKRIGEDYPLEGQTGLILNDVNTSGHSIDLMTQLLTKEGATICGALVIYDRVEEGPSRLTSSGIDYASVLNRRSLRRHCQQLARELDPTDPRHNKASAFLAASGHTEVHHYRGNRAPLDSVRVALAPHIAPPLSAFDEHCQLLDGPRATQRDRLLTAAAEAINQGCGLLVLPELSVPIDSTKDLQTITRANELVVVCGAEYDDLKQNSALVALEGNVVAQPKLVRSPYDLPDLAVGDSITVFDDTQIGRFAVLVCADQISFNLLDVLHGLVDLVVVVARNRATDTFSSAATGDAYRIYALILVVNDDASGPSFLAAPIGGEGALTWFPRAGGEIIIAELDLARLRSRARPFMRETSYD